MKLCDVRTNVNVLTDNSYGGCLTDCILNVSFRSRNPLVQTRKIDTGRLINVRCFVHLKTLKSNDRYSG